MRVRILVSFLVLFVLSTGFGVSAAGNDESLAFTLTDSGLILVPVRINDAGPFLLVLDTGSNRSAVSDTLATRLGLEAVARTQTVTSTGSGTSDVVRLQAVSLGSHSSADVLAPVLTADRVHSVHPKADGIIGQDVLIDAHYTLDYRHKRLIWLAADTDGGSGTRLALRRVEGRLLVELPQSSRPSDVAWFVPDSGASALVLFSTGGRTAVPTMPLRGSTGTTTVNGDGIAETAMVPQLQIGTLTLWDVPAILLAGYAAAGTRVDGLLPLSRFSAVTFNGQEHYMVAKP